MTFAERKKTSELIAQKHPNHIPIIVRLEPKSTGNHQLTHYKYLIPFDNSVDHFIKELRRNIALNSHEGIWLYAGNNLISPQSLITEIYSRHKSDDGFLYITVAFENVFG